MNKSDHRKYRKLYRDVLRGYSEFEYGDKTIYVKHFSEAELGDIEAYDEELYNEAESQGVLTEKEKIKLLVRDKLWSYEKEAFIKEREEEITNLRQSAKKLIISRQVNFALKRIETKQEELDAVLAERESLIGFTVEAYVEKKVSTEYLRYSLFKDKDLKKRHFSEAEFYEVSDVELTQIAVMNNIAMAQLSVVTLRALAACTFFINSLAISKKNPLIFFGIPIKDMSNYQIDIFSNGLRYLSVLEEGKNPTETALKSPELLSEWYEAMIESKSNKSLKPKSNEKENLGGTVFGATKQELENLLGGQAEEGDVMIDLSKEVDKRGGRNLDFADMIEIHGHGKVGEDIRI